MALGSILGGAFGIGSAIFGGISQAKAYKQVSDSLARQKAENDEWYNERYNEDATQRADAQRILNATEESIRQRNRAAAGAQAVMGGTEESVAATKAANAQAAAEAASQITTAAEARKGNVENAYRQQDAALTDEQRKMTLGKQQAIASATANAVKAANNIASAF